MLGKLFKSKQKREMERQMAIQRALALHRQNIAKLQKHERQYMEKALRAKKGGDKANFSRLARMVSQTMNQRRAIESQLLYFETILQTRDRARLMQEFSKGMQAMAKSIGDVFREFNAEEMMKDVETALAKSSHLETTMNMVLDRISESGFSEEVPEDGVSAEQIEKLLTERAAAEEQGGLDEEIDAGLKAIEAELSGDQQQ